MNITFYHSISKIKSVVDAVTLAILQGELAQGENLPSINELSNEYKISRDTVFKAYKELKQKGLIDSNPMKGYFVRGEVNRILLLLDNYSAFKQNLYRRFVENLPENYKVDLIFHQYNRHFFETVVRESLGLYSMYVVMNFSNDEFSDALKSIPQGKLLLLDFGNFNKNGYAYLCQNFDQSFYDCLVSGKEKFVKYKKFVFVFPEELCHPVSSVEYFMKFCAENNLECLIIRKNEDWTGVEKDTVYLTILHEDLVKVIKSGDEREFKIAEDYGVVVYNEDPILEVIKNGIASISIDFGLMGEKAATFVRTQQLVQEYLPTHLILRNSV
ncbi:MAG: GntR family transcriptional regulator [Paludibacter sp.]|nr:GntR family transcriptional regulator [Paludibacter sp.]